jgi:hypothetical protein
MRDLFFDNVMWVDDGVDGVRIVGEEAIGFVGLCGVCGV